MPFLLAVMGATATGKTGVAEALAERFDAQLLNADAFQIYRGMDVGTAKPIRKERYKLLDIRNPDEGFGVGEWVTLAAAELQTLHKQGRNAIVVGGTGLYIRALFEGYATMAAPPDPELRAELERRQADEGLDALAKELQAKVPEVAAKTDLKNPARVRRALERLSSGSERLEFQLPNFKRIKVGLDLSKEVLDARISARTGEMVQNGWVQELERLRDAGYKPEQPGFRAIGYRNLWTAMAGEIDWSEAIATTIAETRRYAKRQRTWLRSEPGLVLVSAERAMEAVSAHL